MMRPARNIYAKRRLRFVGATATAFLLTLAATPAWLGTASADAALNGFTPTLDVDVDLAVGGSWELFFWGSGVAPFASETFHYLTPLFTTLTVTDDACRGDQFRIFDNGVFVGDTSAVAVGACDSVGAEAALADPSYSSGAFVLPPGEHAITIQVIANPFDGGGAWIRADVTEDQLHACSGAGICKALLVEDENGNGILEVGEPLSFHEVITVHNPSETATWTNVVVTDNWGAEVDVLSATPSQGTATLTQIGTSQKEKLKWEVGTLGPGETATLDIMAISDTDPGGHQSYTRCGTFEYNSGAVLKYTIEGKKHASGTGSVTLRVWCEGTLFAGTDHEEFEGQPLPDRLLAMTAIGPFITSSVIHPVDVYVNGLGEAPGGNLFAGDPNSNALHVITPTGGLVSSTTGPYDGDCCQEDFAFDGTHVWRADFVEGPLWQFLPDGTPVASYDQTDVVGAAFVGSTLWLSKWSDQSVGTFDPGTNTYSPMFATSDLAGGLAYDAANNLLWVGLRGGDLQAYDLGVSPPAPIGPGFVAFAPSPHTADGLAFIAS